MREVRVLDTAACQSCEPWVTQLRRHLSLLRPSSCLLTSEVYCGKVAALFRAVLFLPAMLVPLGPPPWPRSLLKWLPLAQYASFWPSSATGPSFVARRPAPCGGYLWSHAIRGRCHSIRPTSCRNCHCSSQGQGVEQLNSLEEKRAASHWLKSREGAPEGSRRDRYQGPAAQLSPRQEILPAFPPLLFVASFFPTLFPMTSGFLAATTFLSYPRCAEVHINGEVRCSASILYLQLVNVQAEVPVANHFPKLALFLSY